MSLAENLDNHFRQKYDLPDEFKFFRWECLPLNGPTIYFEVEGGIVTSVYKSGKRKGRPNYIKATNRKTFRMTVEEYDRLFPAPTN
jgi:hypothetical protein